MTLVQLRDKIQEQLTQLPDDQLTIVNEFLTALNQQSTPTHSTGKTLLAHLQTIGTWAGDDLDECFQTVKNNQLPAQFEYNPNPFD